jgi:hypothetical protein
MPKFVWIADQFGVHPQVWRDDSVLGVDQNKGEALVRAFDISEQEAHFGIDLLKSIYPVDCIE